MSEYESVVDRCNEILALLANASPDEILLVTFRARQIMNEGRTEHGVLDLSNDTRSVTDFVREAHDEKEDASFYLDCAMIKLERGSDVQQSQDGDKRGKFEEEDFDVKNKRRIHLIDRQLERGLTVGESTELAELSPQVVSFVNNKHPHIPPELIAMSGVPSDCGPVEVSPDDDPSPCNDHPGPYVST